MGITGIPVLYTNIYCIKKGWKRLNIWGITGFIYVYYIKKCWESLKIWDIICKWFNILGTSGITGISNIYFFKNVVNV